MTDRLDGAQGAELGDDRSPAGIGPERWLLAASLLGAAAIHMAMTPSHLAESGVEGAGFLVAALVQAALAIAVLVRPPVRLLLVAVGVTNVALVAAWAVSRTAGLPFGSHSGHAESVSVVDGICVALELLGVVVALALGTGRGVALARARGVALVGTVAAVLLTTGAVASPAARDHAAGSHGDHATDDHDHGAATDDHRGATEDHDHGAAGEADEGFAALSNGHQDEHGSDEPLTPEETVALADQLAATAELVEKYPTVADAEAAGWKRAGPFSPGLGVHYGGPNYTTLNTDGDMDPEDLQAPMLVYDGLEPDSQLAGFMYIAFGSREEPEGFAGPNDHWHYHESVCIVRSEDGGIDTPFGADLPGVTEEMCTEVGGNFIAFTGYMVHVWNVPGYESPDGMFTELNRRITCPDGSYDRIPIEDLGTKDTVCPET